MTILNGGVKIKVLILSAPSGLSYVAPRVRPLCFTDH